MNTPLRVATLLPGATEILYGLGLGEQVVAVSHECDYPAEVRSKPRVTISQIDSAAASQKIDDRVKELISNQTALYSLNAELLGSLSPDLIVTQAQCDVCAISLQDVLHSVQSHPLLRGTAVLDLNPQSLSELFCDIERIGSATNQQDRANIFVAGLQARLNAIRDKLADIPRPARPTVACIEWTEPLMLAGNWVPELIEAAGGRNELTQAGVHSPYVGWETIAAADPDVLLISPCGFDLPRAECRKARSLKKLPGWEELSAVRHGRTFAIDGNAYLNRPGPRLVDSVEIIAHLLYPARIPEPARCENGHTPWQRFI